MNSKMNPVKSNRAAFARFRFSVIGPLLSSPPASGELQLALAVLAQKQWLHPVTKQPMTLGVSTLERWYYKARTAFNPLDVLAPKKRHDSGQSKQLSLQLKDILRVQHQEHPSWSYQLQVDNLMVRAKQLALQELPSYSTVRRYMKANDLYKRKNIRRHHTAGAEKAALRLEQREVRSYEVDYVHGLWHLDFHHGSRKIACKDGQWRKPLLLCILDDHSRLVCHAQWYLDETSESLVHGFIQALQKRDLPRALMSDNGSAMISAEFTQGLERLGILHQPTLPYSPYQNAKQEVFWAQVEGRLMAMLEGQVELDLATLNKATLAWVEFEYQRKWHSQIAATPLERYTQSRSVGRPCPEGAVLKAVFCAEVIRKQRRSDGTISLNGHRFEVPSAYRHMETLSVRYRHWDMSYVLLVDPHTNACVDRLYPWDKSANATGLRRTLSPTEKKPLPDLPQTNTAMPPLLEALMAQYAATGLPPAYIPKGE